MDITKFRRDFRKEPLKPGEKYLYSEIDYLVNVQNFSRKDIANFFGIEYSWSSKLIRACGFFFYLKPQRVEKFDYSLLKRNYLEKPLKEGEYPLKEDLETVTKKLTQKDASKLFGCPHSTISTWVKKLGIQYVRKPLISFDYSVLKRDYSKCPLVVGSELPIKEDVEFLLDNYGFLKAADILGYPINTFYKVLYKLNLQNTLKPRALSSQEAEDSLAKLKLSRDYRKFPIRGAESPKAEDLELLVNVAHLSNEDIGNYFGYAEGSIGSLLTRLNVCRNLNTLLILDERKGQKESKTKLNWTKETLEAINAKTKATWDKKSKEELDNINKKKSLNKSKWWKNLSDEEYKQVCGGLRTRRILWWNKLPEEEKKKQGERISKGLANMSPEEKRKQKEAMRKFWASRTKEQFAVQVKKATETKKKNGTLTSSNKEKAWLAYLNKEIDRQHFLYPCYVVDGYEPETQTIYEFLGDFYHGHPDFERYTKEKENNPWFKQTEKRFQELKELGYNIIYCWERDWDNQTNLQRKFVEKLEW